MPTSPQTCADNVSAEICLRGQQEHEDELHRQAAADPDARENETRQTNAIITRTRRTQANALAGPITNPAMSRGSVFT